MTVRKGSVGLKVTSCVLTSSMLRKGRLIRENTQSCAMKAATTYDQRHYRDDDPAPELTKVVHQTHGISTARLLTARLLAARLLLLHGPLECSSVSGNPASIGYLEQSSHE